MTAKNLDELIGQLIDMHRQRSVAEYQRSRLLDRQGKPLGGRENEVRAFREKIKAIDDDIRKMLEEWTKEQVTRAIEGAYKASSQPIVFEARIEANLDIVKDALLMEKITRSGHVSVPVGQVFVFAHENIDEGGFPEVYLGGEKIIPRRKDHKSLVAALAEWPGDVRCVVNQWLAGISVSKENTAKVSIQIPVSLHDPIQTLKRSGGAWMSSAGRKNINTDLCSHIEHEFQEILADRAQFWSADERNLLDRICAAINRDLNDWGLQVKPEGVSLIRQLPKTIYEIVLQFGKAEQSILDLLSTGEKEKALVSEQTGLSADDLTFIEAAAERENAGRGEGLFLVLQDKMPNLEEKSELKEKMFNWLRIHAGASAANYFNEIMKLYSRLTKGDFKSDKESGLGDIHLSEQVVLSAFRNPMIGLGEGLESAA